MSRKRKKKEQKATSQTLNWFSRRFLSSSSIMLSHSGDKPAMYEKSESEGEEDEDKEGDDDVGYERLPDEEVKQGRQSLTHKKAEIRKKLGRKPKFWGTRGWLESRINL